MKRSLYIDPTGPMVRYENSEVLEISDLNPEVKLTWHMSRWELFCFGLRCAWRAAVTSRFGS